MAQGLFDKVYNPDVLSCLANLSNDEVFTPPEIANQMLDMLPQELFENPDTTFLDPACKSGVFLREIAKRLLKAQLPGYEDMVQAIEEKKRHNIPLDAADTFFEETLQKKVDHIFHKQLFGIAITELTSLLSRRSVYCSKYPNTDFSVTKFENEEGNVRFRRVEHGWDRSGKCVFCGASKEQYERGDDLETHAYEWIHTMKPEEIFNMKFDVICSNPPYQLSTGGGQENSARQAKPIYHKFVEQAKQLKPRYLTMIIPSRWFAGGMGLEEFRKSMMEDGGISHLVDYPNAKDCFPQNSISGGVCYFLWEKDVKKDCSFVSINGKDADSMIRPLNEFDTIVRYNKAVRIIHSIKAQKEPSMAEIVSAISPFGISTKIRGSAEPNEKENIRLYSSAGVSYIEKQSSFSKSNLYDAYKVMVSQTSAEHAGEPAKDGKFRVLTSSMRILAPTEVCSHSYVAIGPYENEQSAENVIAYLKTKFARFLILQALTSIHISRSTFAFVPQQDFSKQWTDEELYKKYNLTEDEIAFIDSMIKPFDQGGVADA